MDEAKWGLQGGFHRAVSDTADPQPVSTNMEVLCMVLVLSCIHNATTNSSRFVRMSYQLQGLPVHTPIHAPKKERN